MRMLFAISGLALLGLATSPPLAAQGFIKCGDTIVKSAHLSVDLACDENPALTVRGKGLLNFDRFTVTCNNPLNNGIRLTSENAVIVDGTVSGCKHGVVLAGKGGHYVHKMIAENNNRDGFSVLSPGNLLSQNNAINNGRNGFNIRNEDNFLVSNDAKGNTNHGFAVHSGNGTVGGNVSNNNGADGIRLSDDATNTTVTTNSIAGNGTQGIEIESDANRITGNQIDASGRQGILLQNGAENNEVTSNTVLNNKTDLEDKNANCDANFWNNNEFDTEKSDDCIQ